MTANQIDSQSPILLETFCTSGSSPTLHLVGAGQVGQAFLRLLAEKPLQLIGISDSSATLHDADGLSALALASFKAESGRLVERDGAEALPTGLAVDLVDADLVIDATPSGLESAGESLARCRKVLGGDGRLVLAAKNALAFGAWELLAEPVLDRIGFNAVLGGTGLLLKRELAGLRRDCASIALVANASTTAVIERVEKGDSIDEGIAAAQHRGVLEPDPGLDLRGVDAATKLAIVTGAVFGHQVHPEVILGIDLRDLDPNDLRERATRGKTTRLVARADRKGRVSLAYEELDRGSALAVPSDRVAYSYQVRGLGARLHVGMGVGPAGTALALLEDVEEFCTSERASRGAIR